MSGWKIVHADGERPASRTFHFQIVSFCLFAGLDLDTKSVCTDVGLHPTAKQTQEYLESYAEHFELNCYIKLASTVLKIERDNTQQKWLVTTTFKGSTTTKPETCVFDRLILATGPHSRIKMPKLECSDRFEGDLVHSQQFKEPAKYAGKAVVVLGTGATAADIMEFLRVAGANKIYMSHRRSFRLVRTSVRVCWIVHHEEYRGIALR